MDGLNIQTSQNVDISYEPASIGDRLLGAIFDNFIIFCFLYLVFGFVDSENFNEKEINAEQLYLLIVILLIPYMFYNLLFEIFMNGRSPGKIIRNTKVIKIDGTQAGLSAYFLRWIFRPIDTVFGGVFGIVVIAVSMKGQRIGDIAAGTAVVKIKPRVTLEEALGFIVNDDKSYIVTYPKAIELDDIDVNVIKDVLHFCKTNYNTKHLNSTSKKVQELLCIDYIHEDDETFLKTIIKDHSFLSK